MEQIEGVEVNVLTEAATLWLGTADDAPASELERQLEVRLGPGLTTRVLRAIDAMEDEAYRSDAKNRASSLQEMRDLVVQDLRKKYPQAPDDLLIVFGNRYTYDFK